jgi:dTDP-4-dehydrorhamnose 3,5-epimerase
LGKLSVKDIVLTPLKRIPLAEGDVLHGMKNSDQGFVDFGESYFSIIKPHSIKGWKRHIKMTLNLIAPIGEVEFTFVDEIQNSMKFKIGEKNYSRLTVPPGIWFAFKGIAEPYSLLNNIANIEHDPNEVERVSLEDFKNYPLKKML